MRVVLDTNVIISALSYGGKPLTLLSLARKGEIELLISPFILDELTRVLQDKFAWNLERAERVRFRLRRVAKKVIIPPNRLTVLADDADNRILECAVEGMAQAIVTGDKDLLGLKTYQGIAIVTPAEFLRRIKTQ